MIKLLIVDDEPLVQVGIKSMLNWNEYGIEVCGAAFNGKQALTLIKQHSPRIVITDIKMPIMDGLELIKTCQDTYGKFPLFIILTSYEEFPFIKEAVKYGILDYLIKLELTAEVLEETIAKALNIIQEYNYTLPSGDGETNIHNFYEKFFIYLLHNLFGSESQFRLQAKDLNLDFTAKSYVSALCTIAIPGSESMEQAKLIKLYYSTIQMLRELIAKYIPCYLSSLELKHFCIIFCLEADNSTAYREKITKALQSSFAMVHNYFNVTIHSSVGSIRFNPLAIAESYQEARQLQSYCRKEKPIVFFDDFRSCKENFGKNTFNMGLFKDTLLKAFEEFDPEILKCTLTEIIHLFQMYPAKYLQAMDATSNILHLAISLLPDGEETVAGLFQNYPDGYQSIYKQINMEQVINWMELLRDGLYETLKSKHKAYKNLILANVKTYIDSHVEEKLTLNDTAALFGITPNYLSLQFKKTFDTGFTDYITQKKISRAKMLMISEDLKIYEIADRLGFESAFYFSKVFKKVEGCSPREYLQTKL